ncbi:MAG: bifunctional homocysteine S-methyltransferase/methylenetetrahydrofolate reductase [Lachnospiraceae bacterium]|nr:bifunctional homocysteine S-methyltransferase/methylenetetrahydrofolate reductase [Lachnospiraceae bacterium]
MNIREALKQKILLADGAMGTWFESLYCREDREYPETAVMEHPEWITDIHRQYINAGADIIRTNTFALNHRLIADKDRLKQAIIQNILCAKNAAMESEREIYIAASVGPMKYRNEEEEYSAGEEYKFIVDVFFENGIDIFVLETFFDVDMAKRTASYIKEKRPNAFVIVQFAFYKTGYTRYGFPMQRLVDILAADKNIDVFGFNCGIGAAHMSELFGKICFPKECLVSVLPNAGYQQELTGRDMYFQGCGYYAKYVERMIEQGVNIIGGCCGTSPEYIKELQRLLKKNPKPRAKRISSVKNPKKLDMEENLFMQKLEHGEKVFVVELDSPFQKNADKFIEGAFRLKENQVDMVTISDSPMGKPRADSFEMAVYVQNKTGLMVMPHITCRDRNVIALHSAFLGAHINEIRNLLVITGDPVAREDRDTITPVFDFYSVKLMQYIKNMNEEIFEGEPFYYGGALNYAGGNLEIIARKMRMKIEAGCSYFLTQPVYSIEDIDRVRKLKEMTEAKIICGILPLVSLKNALFMKNEMPGISVPEEVVARYHADMEREEAEATAVEISVEIGKSMKDFADGYYIITPFQRVNLVNRIIYELRKIII